LVKSRFKPFMLFVIAFPLRHSQRMPFARRKKPPTNSGPEEIVEPLEFAVVRKEVLNRFTFSYQLFATPLQFLGRDMQLVDPPNDVLVNGAISVHDLCDELKLHQRCRVDTD